MSVEIGIDFLCDACNSRLQHRYLNSNGPQNFAVHIQPCAHCAMSLEQRKTRPDICPNCGGKGMIWGLAPADGSQIMRRAFRCARCYWEVNTETGSITCAGEGEE